MPRLITKEYKIPIKCDQKFIEKLKAYLLYLRFAGYDVRENCCIPSETLKYDELLRFNGQTQKIGTYVMYEVCESQNGDWLFTIVLNLEQPKRQKLKLKSRKMKLKDATNRLFDLELEISIEEEPCYKSEKFSLDYEGFFKRIESLLKWGQ